MAYTLSSLHSDAAAQDGAADATDTAFAHGWIRRDKFFHDRICVSVPTKMTPRLLDLYVRSAVWRRGPEWIQESVRTP